MALKIEEKLLITAEISNEHGLVAHAMICNEGAVAIRILRDRIDELGGYHDDV
jgi:hypothetical protein